MKKIKFTLLATMLAVATVVSAQTSFGVKAGANMSNFYGKEINDNNLKIGFHVGLTADIELMPSSAIQTGLLFTTKGFKYETNALKYVDNLMYVQLPIHYAYKVDVTPGTRIVFHGGPYAAYGVGGKRSLKVGDFEPDPSSKIFGDGISQYKPFDAGLGLGVGAEFGNIAVDLGWDMGMVNLSNVDDATVKNQNAYLSVGLKF